MRTIKFHKMHGAGNDYVYVDARDEKIENPEALAIKISDRHFGVGSDGLVLIMNSEVADFRMRMFNADGSEAGMCGNASRCVGRYVYELGLTDKQQLTLETKSGIKKLKLAVNRGVVSEVSVDMNTPQLGANQIPVLYEDTHSIPIIVEERKFVLTCISMGNPHAVTFVDNVDLIDVERYGSAIENHPLFPERCNVEFAEIVSPGCIKMRVWERGSGETMACGTGACATLVAAVLNNQSDRDAIVMLRGGAVYVSWDITTDRVTLTGRANWVFEGKYIID